LVDEAEYKRLQSVKEKIPVYRHLLPFVPHMLLGLIISLLWGNVLFVLAGMGPLGF
jgi:prepilin signal peptidase PulO-like enzyme (type II secretory pathway)